MANIGREHVEFLAKRGQALHRRLEGLKERLTGATRKAVRTLEVAAAAGAGGLIQGKAGEEGSHIFHVPTDLGLGLGLNLLGYFNAAGDHSEHLNNLGDGFLASFTSSVGFGWGNTWRTTGKFQLTSKPAPAGLPAGAGSPVASAGEISSHQMADIVARVRAAAHHG